MIVFKPTPMTYEAIVPGLRWKNGTLQQCTKITTYVSGVLEDSRYEWRDVPRWVPGDPE